MPTRAVRTIRRAFRLPTSCWNVGGNLNVPAFELLDSRASGVDRQVGDQFPTNLLSVAWCCGLLGAYHRQHQSGVSLPLPDGWLNADLSIRDLKQSLVGITAVVPHCNAMPFLEGDLTHLVGYGLIAIAGMAKRLSTERRPPLSGF
jgi:hypothetical protein